MNDREKRIQRAQIAPELRASAQMVPVPVKTAFGRRLVRGATKLMVRETQHEGLQIEKHQSTSGEALRVYLPDKKQAPAALLWIHGGGMVIGSALQDDLFCANTVRSLGIAILSVEYRLAPEFPFPAALDDCFAAWTWLQQAASNYGIDKTCIAVGGQSAGGGLAASLVQRIYDDKGVQPAAQWLFCPMLDDRTAARRELDSIKHPIWDNQLNYVGWSAFLGNEPGTAVVPRYAVPARREDLSGLPPAWIGTGDIELFFEEDTTYAERLKAAGVDTTLDVVSGAFHGFERIAHKTQLAQEYIARSHKWLRDTLTTPSSS